MAVSDDRETAGAGFPYSAAGDDIFEWLSRRGHGLSDLDGKSKRSGKRPLCWNGVPICSRKSDCSKLNSYNISLASRKHPFLQPDEIVRLAALCGRSAAEALALSMKNAFEAHVKARFRTASDRLFGDALDLLCDDKEALGDAEDAIFEAAQAAMDAAVKAEARFPGTFGDVSHFDGGLRHATIIAMRSLRFKSAFIAKEIGPARELATWSREIQESSAWHMFGDISDDADVAELVRMVDDASRSRSPLPFVHYHDAQGAFWFPNIAEFSSHVLTSFESDRLVSFRIGCVFVCDKLVAVFPGIYRYFRSAVSPIRPEDAPTGAMNDHIRSIATHLSSILPPQPGQGLIIPLGIANRRNERVALASEFTVRCAHSLCYLYAVHLPSAWPLPGCQWAAGNLSEDLLEDEPSLLEALRMTSGDGRRNKGSLTVAAFPPVDAAVCANVGFAHNPSGASPAPQSGALPPTPPPGAAAPGPAQVKRRCRTP